jgi:hypothetical protein
LLLAFVSAVILGIKSCGTYNHILLFLIPDFPNVESRIPAFISPKNKVVSFYPQALVSFLAFSCDPQGYGGST